MAKHDNNDSAVYGHRIGAPRVTGAALRIAVLRVGVPLITGLVAFDLVVWWVVRALGGGCFAIWCWL